MTSLVAVESHCNGPNLVLILLFIHVDNSFEFLNILFNTISSPASKYYSLRFGLRYAAESDTWLLNAAGTNKVQ